MPREKQSTEAARGPEETAAARLRRLAPELLETWAARARAEIPAARATRRPALYDRLPLFLESLGKALEPGASIDDVCAATGVCQQHGEERARDPDYTLEQVLREYYLLHLTILEGLLEGGSLSEHERTVILTSIHRAIQEAAGRFEEVHGRQTSEADRRKDEFLALLGHELRNPLAAISNGLHLLDSYGSPDAHAERLRAMMARQVKHLGRLVEDLLDLSRIARGKIYLRRERVDLAQAAAQAAQAARPQFEERQHELLLDLGEDEVWVKADPVRIEQIIANLLNNAAKYTLPGGTIQLQLRVQEPAFARLSVRDTGIGIEPENLARIFEMFTQGEAPSDRAQSGLGIGLSLVRQLVEMHGGSVEARSEGAGQGSEFVVRLPITS